MVRDLTGLSVKELLQLDAGIISELRERGLVRTNNKPLGDIAEQVVLGARGGVLEPNSTKSHDVTAKDGRKIQVKAMGGRAAGCAGKFSPFRSFDFDTTVFLVFAAETFDLVLAREISVDALGSMTRISSHTNGREATPRQVRDVGVDVLVEMREAYEALDAHGVEFRFNV